MAQRDHKDRQAKTGRRVLWAPMDSLVSPVLTAYKAQRGLRAQTVLMDRRVSVARRAIVDQPVPMDLRAIKAQPVRVANQVSQVFKVKQGLSVR